MIRRPPRSTLSSSSAASDVYKRQELSCPSGYSKGHTLDGTQQFADTSGTTQHAGNKELKMLALLTLVRVGSCWLLHHKKKGNCHGPRPRPRLAASADRTRHRLEGVYISSYTSSSSNSPSSSAVASWYCWYSDTRSFMLSSATVNSISSMPSAVYQ
eukprot:TRINITY_DN1313_c0_g1_i3.p1 TRINITY_DN1313_c0_g1~~TRINITY_DN1313_c0_g1_i3.p1  ORF type:complete len:157 (+),score=3.16 TRINITY_DN1313_c0_g1_i3:94-564(+)